MKLTVKGLQGGHSGMDISLYRANANKVMARILLPFAVGRVLEVEVTVVSAVPQGFGDERVEL